MGNIIDYIYDVADKSFGELPFNEIDALCISQFSYMKWEEMIPGLKDNCEGITLKELYKKNKDEYGNNLAVKDILFSGDNEKMLEAMASAERFNDMSCNYMSYETRDDLVVQFLAFTVFPKDARPVIVFRGTDETITGWKEDCNMVFAKPVPGQSLSALYLKQVSLRIEGDFCLTGHSKGGNFAVYAGMQSGINEKNRIKKIYNFDGPGFHPDIYKEYQYREIEDKVKKFLPQSSIVGMILENKDDYLVVRSNSIGGILQHNLFFWEIKDGGFIYFDELKRGVENYDKSLNHFIYDLDEEQMLTLVNTIFLLADKTGVKTLGEIADNKKYYINRILKEMKDLNPETKRKLKKIITFYFKILLIWQKK